jgi:hypothetical protein
MNLQSYQPTKPMTARKPNLRGYGVPTPHHCACGKVAVVNSAGWVCQRCHDIEVAFIHNGHAGDRHGVNPRKSAAFSVPSGNWSDVIFMPTMKEVVKAEREIGVKTDLWCLKRGIPSPKFMPHGGLA